MFSSQIYILTDGSKVMVGGGGGCGGGGGSDGGSGLSTSRIKNEKGGTDAEGQGRVLFLYTAQEENNRLAHTPKTHLVLSNTEQENYDLHVLKVLFRHEKKIAGETKENPSL